MARGASAGPRVISETTAAMRHMMRKVVSEGTASFGEVPGYAVGGKTGTADKPKARGGGYYDDKVIATFASIFPAHDPKYVLVVTLDEPVETSGASRAAPQAGPRCPWPPRSSVASRRFWGCDPRLNPGGWLL